MTIRYVTTKFPYTVYNLVNKQWVVGSKGVEDVTSKTVNKPPSVYRKKPVDLWGSGTARTISAVYIQTDTLDYVYFGGTRWNRGEPASKYFPMTALTPSLPTVSWANLENRVRSDLRGKAINLAMFVAEYPKAAALFYQAAKVVTSKGRSLAGALNTRQGVAKAHLKFVYGVQPLCSDMVSALDELASPANVAPVIKGRKNIRNRRVVKSSVHFSSTNHNFDAPSEVEFDKRERLRYRATMSTNTLTTSLYAHGFTNPFSLAYELTPFSFVVDWWINVGDVLASLDNSLVFSSLQGVRSYTLYKTERVLNPGFRLSNGDSLSPSQCSRIEVTSDRGAPYNMSLISTFSYKPSISKQHILNGLALLNAVKIKF